MSGQPASSVSPPVGAGAGAGAGGGSSGVSTGAVSPSGSASGAGSCCENGRPIMTDPVSGQTVCSCQYDSARLALSSYPRAAVYGAPYPSTDQNPYPSIDSSAFYSPLVSLPLFSNTSLLLHIHRLARQCWYSRRYLLSTFPETQRMVFTFQLTFKAKSSVFKYPIHFCSASKKIKD